MNKGSMTISQLYSAHQGKISDKWTRYLSEYDFLLNDLRDKPIRLLEIGIQNGGGLEIWADYFKNGQKFIGCDINPDCAALRFDDSRIAIVIGDATTELTQKEILLHSPDFDIVIEDGSHRSGDIIRAFLRYFPNIVDGGIFVAEDLHASYWNEYEGGLFAPYSSISFFKRLVDILNSEHWGVRRNPADLLKVFQEKYEVEVDAEILEHIHSVKFVNSLCIIRKSQPSENKLGLRFIAGSISTVSSEMVPLLGSSLVPPSQDANRWATRVLPAEEELLEREQEVQTLSERISMIEQESKILRDRLILAEQDNRSLNSELDEIHRGRAWRMIESLWRFRSALLPHESGREKLLKFLFRPIRYYQTRGKLAQPKTESTAPVPIDIPGARISSDVELNETSEVDDRQAPYIGSLPVFITPFVHPRLNILLNGINSNQPFGRSATALVFSSILAEKFGYDLRIVTAEDPKNKQYFHEILGSNNISWERNVEFLTINPKISKAELPVGKGDIFLATNWWTAASIVNVFDNHKIIYLLQADERENQLQGEQLRSWLGKLQNPQIKFVVKTRALFQHLVSDGFENVQKNGLWFEPSWPERLFNNDQDRPDNRKNLFFTVSGNSESLVDLGMDAIDAAVTQGIFDPGKWNFYLASRLPRRNNNSQSLFLRQYQDIGWEEYLSLVRRTDLGFCLTVSDYLQPDFHPLDMIASGVVTVTNWNGSDIVSKNLVHCNIQKDAMTQALANGVALTQNPGLALQNFGENKLQNDWQVAFQEVLLSMKSWGENVFK